MPRKLSDGKSNPRNSKIAGFKELRQTIGGLNSAFPNTVFWCFFAPLPSIRAHGDTGIIKRFHRSKQILSCRDRHIEGSNSRGVTRKQPLAASE